MKDKQTLPYLFTKLHFDIFQFVKYGVVGTINFIIDFSIVKYLSLSTGITSGSMLVVFNIIAFIAYSFSGFYMNKRFTFKVEKGSFKMYFRYILVLGIGLVLNSILLLAFTYRNPLISLGMSNETILELDNRWFSIAKFLASNISGLFNFLLNKYKAFVPDKSGDTSSHRTFV